MRVRSIKLLHSESSKEELVDFTEEIGDIDPKKQMEINLQFEEDLLKCEADTFWCLSKIIDDI